MSVTNSVLIGSLLVVGLFGWYSHVQFLNERLAYSGFRETSAAKALKQKEEHNEQVTVAMAERDASLARMRDSQKRTHALQRTITASKTGKVCFRSEGLDAAYRELVSEIRAIAGEGQAGLIDNKAWASAWPK